MLGAASWTQLLCCCASEGSQPSPGLPARGWACLLPLLFPRACAEPVGRWMMPFFVPLPCSRVCTGGSICQSPLPADAAATEPCWGARQAKAASSIGPDQHCLAVGAAEPRGRGTSEGLFGVFCGFLTALAGAVAYSSVSAGDHGQALQYSLALHSSCKLLPAQGRADSICMEGVAGLGLPSSLRSMSPSKQSHVLVNKNLCFLQPTKKALRKA